MGFWSKVGSLFVTKSAPGLGPLDVDASFQYPLYNQPPKRGTRELIQAHKKIPILRAVCDLISTHCAQVPWRVYVRSSEPSTAKTWRYGIDRAVADPVLRHGNFEARAARRKALTLEGTLRELPDHPILTFLNEPNERHTGLAARKMLRKYLEVKGEAFMAIERNDEGMPLGWYPIPPHWIIDVPSRALPNQYRISYGTIQGYIPDTEIVWLRDLDPENPMGRGTGVAEALGDELETDEYAAKMVKAWFYNTGTPGFIASMEGASPSSLKELKEKWDREYGASSNYGRGHFTGHKLTLQRLDTSFKDMQLSQLRRDMRDFVRQTYGIPPEVLGIVENSNRATIQSAFFLFATGVIQPRLEFDRTEFQQRLVPMFDDRLILDYESPVPEDKEFSLKVATVLPGAFSLNEWRAFAGHEPVPEFNGIYPPLSMPGQAPGTAADQVAGQEPEPNDKEGEIDREEDEAAEDS